MQERPGSFQIEPHLQSFSAHGCWKLAPQGTPSVHRQTQLQSGHGARQSFERLKEGDMFPCSIPAIIVQLRTRRGRNRSRPRAVFGAHDMKQLSAIVFAVRRILAAKGIIISTGHAQQLATAALGHNNLSSYQASDDDAGLARASVIAFDVWRLHDRATRLGHDVSTFAQALSAALDAGFPDARIYSDQEDWLTDVQNHFELAIVNDGHIESEVAMANGTFPRIDIELPWWETLDDYDGDDLSIEIEGVVTVDQDDDRAYYGHEIDVRAMLTVERFGRRLFGEYRLEVEKANLRWLGEPNPSF